MKRKASVIALAITLGVSAVVPAIAEPGDDTDLEEIVITARRIEERLQEVPISVTVFNQQQLADRNISNVGDLSVYTPSLTTDNRFGNDNTSFTLRGFSQDLQTAPTVGVYFADVVAPRGGPLVQTGDGAGPGALFDLQNVQILKGPQGTLFGRNTTGGDVLLVPKKPTSEFEGYAEGSYGNYAMGRVQAVLNMPLNENIRVRLGVDRQTRNGYLENISGIGPPDFGDINYTAFRLSVVADITPNLENYTIASLTNSTDHGLESQIFACNPPVALFGTPLSCNQLAQMQGHGNYVVDNDLASAQSHVNQWQVINTTTWKASDVLTVKNIASYAELVDTQRTNLFGNNWILPATFGPLAGTHIPFVSVDEAPGSHVADQSTTTEELQFQGNALDTRLTWQAGGYLELSDPLSKSQIVAPQLINCANPYALQCTDVLGELFGVPVGSEAIKFASIFRRDVAGYVQSTYAFTPKFKLTAGARYTSDVSSAGAKWTEYHFPAGGAPVASCGSAFTTLAAGCFRTFYDSSHAPTWLIDFDYLPRDGVLAYAKYSRGYRQGDANPLGADGYTSWGPEKVDTYEIGTKTSIHGPVPATLDVAAFYNDFTNQQIFVGFQGGPTVVPNNSDVNAGKSRIWGAEVEAAVTPFRGFMLDTAYTYLNSKLQQLNPIVPIAPYILAQPSSVAGQRLGYTPTSKVTAAATYALPLDEKIGKVDVGVNYVYTSSIQVVVNSPFGVLPPFGLLGGDVNWTSIGGKPVDVSFFITNATNHLYRNNLVDTFATVGFEPQILAEPRMFGMRVRVHFGAKP